MSHLSINRRYRNPRNYKSEYENSMPEDVKKSIASLI
jgi:hypothetical protein